jgi:hypothetical protein
MTPTAMRTTPIVHRMPTPKIRPSIKWMTPRTITPGDIPPASSAYTPAGHACGCGLGRPPRGGGFCLGRGLCVELRRRAHALRVVRSPRGRSRRCKSTRRGSTRPRFSRRARGCRSTSPAGGPDIGSRRSQPRVSSTAGHVPCGTPIASWAIAARLPTFEIAATMGTSLEQLDKSFAHLLPDPADRARTALDAFVAASSETFGEVAGTQTRRRFRNSQTRTLLLAGSSASRGAEIRTRDLQSPRLLRRCRRSTTNNT